MPAWGGSEGGADGNAPAMAHTRSMNETADWLHMPWLGFDTETTGVDPFEDRLVTCALVLRMGGIDTGRPDRVHTWLADPGVEIPATATAVHGISTEKARAEGRPVDEALDEIAATLVEHWRRGYPVVAFNASYDLTLVDAELARHGLGTFAQRLGREAGPIIDPLVLDRHFERYRKGKKTLTLVAPAYGVEASPDAHTAEVDVAMTLDVLAAMAAKHTDLQGLDARELQAAQARWHREWAEGLAEYLRKQGRDASIDPSWPMLAADSQSRQAVERA